MASKIKVKQIRSAIGRPKDQKATVVGLGLGSLNQVVEIEDTPAVRGMINKVSHLVIVEA